MRRIVRIVALACVGSALFVPTSGAEAAVDPNMVCPDMFVPFLALIAPPGTDKNGNLIVCVKEADSMLIWRDDLLPTGG